MLAEGTQGLRPVLGENEEHRELAVGDVLVGALQAHPSGQPHDRNAQLVVQIVSHD